MIFLIICVHEEGASASAEDDAGATVATETGGQVSKLLVICYVYLCVMAAACKVPFCTNIKYSFLH